MKYVTIFFPNSYHKDTEKIKLYLSKRGMNLDKIWYYTFYPDSTEEIIIKDSIKKENKENYIDEEKKDTKNSNHSIFWWIIIILFLIVCFFAGYSYTKNNESIDNSKQNDTKVISSVDASFDKKYKYLAQITYTDQKDNKDKSQNILCKSNVELNQVKGAYNQVDSSKNMKLKLNSNTTLYSDDISGLRIFKINDPETKNIINSEGATTDIPTAVDNE